jgi:hypothetical protein
MQSEWLAQDAGSKRGAAMNGRRKGRLATGIVSVCALAALPAWPSSAQVGQFDGVWRVRHSSATCDDKGGSFTLTIAKGSVRGRIAAGSISGTVSASGVVRWTHAARSDATPVIWQGRLHGNTGAGSYERQDGKCHGTFALRRG